MNFVSVDVETANADLASICQIGIVSFKEGRVIDTWQTILNPEDIFSPINVSIHGISEKEVQGAPTFPQVYGTITNLIQQQRVVSHSSFDRMALDRISEKYQLNKIECRWLDTTRVVRRTWPQFAYKGYALNNIAKYCGIEFVHHDAGEDARVAGEVLIRAINETGLDLNDWYDRVGKPIDPSKNSATSSLSREGNPEGQFAGEVLVFTGALTIPRREAASLAAEAGFTVAPGVTKLTTLVVVGDQDIRKLHGQGKSTKHLKAEKLIAKGNTIRILTERDFKQIIEV